MSNKKDNILALPALSLVTTDLEDLPGVDMEVALAVVVGEQHVSLDEAVNVLGQIQDQERKLKQLKKRLKPATEFALRRAGIPTYETPEGRSATTYEQEREKCDKAFLKELLSPEDYARAFPKQAIQGMRVR